MLGHLLMHQRTDPRENSFKQQMADWTIGDEILSSRSANLSFIYLISLRLQPLLKRSFEICVTTQLA